MEKIYIFHRYPSILAYLSEEGMSGLMETSSKNTTNNFVRNEKFHDMGYMCRSPEDYSLSQIWIY